MTKIVCILLMLLLVPASLLAMPSIDELPDLTGGVIAILSYDTGAGETGGGQLFSGGHLSSRGHV